MKIKRKLAAFAAAAITASSVTSGVALADWMLIGHLGDLNGDKTVTVADLLIMSKHLLGQEALTNANFYRAGDSYIGIDGADGFKPGEYLVTADINQDGTVDVFDFALLRKDVINAWGPVVWQWFDNIPQVTTTTTSPQIITTTTTTATTPTPVETEQPSQKEFMSPPVADLYGSMPSQGEAKLAIFYVDFPDCKFTYEPTTDQIEDIAFGPADPSNSNYPFDSMSAFYGRSSKGALQLSGQAFRYTTKQSKSVYENDPWHVVLINEIIEEYKNKIDFTQFDGNNDRTTDAILISVPTAAGDDNWWPAAGQFGGESYNRADGMNIGHVIVGNAQIDAAADWYNFCRTYLHEMGHCMGLPDYYLYDHYSGNDFDGLHGSAGYDMMDDAHGDFNAASKLMLGWYTTDQVSVYDPSKGTQSFKLNNAQGDNSNCVIIPYGQLHKNYYSEFFILEYSTLDRNNSSLSRDYWWLPTGSGVRAFHVEGTNNGNRWYNYWKYASGEDENTRNNSGRRFIRLVNEGTSSSRNLLTTGAVIDSSMNGFQWYDSSDSLTVDPGVKITIGERSGDSYTITISPK